MAGVEEAPLRYRVYLPAEALGLLGISSRICFYTDKDLDEAADTAEIVVLHRVRATNEILKLIAKLRAKKIPVLYDVDDLIFDLESARKIPWLETRPAKEVREFLEDVTRYRTAIEACDGLITSTDTLCKEARRVIGIPTRHFPNGIGVRLDQLSQAALDRIPFSTKPRLCYLSGTSTHQRDYETIEPALSATLETFSNVELCLVGNVEPSASVLRFAGRIQRLDFQPWQYLPHLTRQMSINLAPLMLNNIFNESKSAIKWMEAALVGVPTIASSTAPNREMIEHGRNGFLAKSIDEWNDCLSRLIQDREMRERVGKQARNDAIDKLNARRQAERYVDLIEWAIGLNNYKLLSTGTVAVVPDNLLKPHPLEPYDLTLAAGITGAQAISSDLDHTTPLSFSLNLGRSKRIRIDLLFATHNGPGAAIELHLHRDSSGQLIGHAKAEASQIVEGAWAAFDFESTHAMGRCELRVLLAESDPNKTSRVALWTSLTGTHIDGGKRRIGTPCIRLWVDEQAQVESTPVISNEPVGATDRLRARLQFARYVYESEGLRKLITRSIDFLARNKTRWMKA